MIRKHKLMNILKELEDLTFEEKIVLANATTIYQLVKDYKKMGE